jgi:uncharacterized protein
MGRRQELRTLKRCYQGLASLFVDDRFDYGEERFITLGLLGDRLVVIAHAPHGDDTTRIISMRKANRREQKIYQKRLGAP